MKIRTYEKIFSILSECPKVDIHTHLTADRLMARGLDNILLYHMVNSELYAAGSPCSERVSDNRDEQEAEIQLSYAVPYLTKIRNKSLYRVLRIILRDIYGWKEDITPHNWKTLHEHIKSQNGDDGRRARKIINDLQIKRVGTEIVRRADGRADDIFSYALGWAFFARA